MEQENRNRGLATPPLAPQEDCDPFMDSSLVKVVKTIMYAALLIVALVGNSLVIAVIWRNRKLHTVINFFIFNMAISDVLTPLMAIPIRIKDIYLQRGVWLVDGVIGSVTCKFLIFTEDLSLIVSVLTLELIAIERFFSIVFPMKKQPIQSKRTCFILIGFTWLIGTVYPCIHFYKLKITHKKTIPYCLSTWEPAFDNAEAIKIEYPIFLACFTMIPFILLTSLYSAIIVSLHRQQPNLHLASVARQRRIKKYRRATYMLVTVVVVFLASWLPLNIYLFLRAFIWRSYRICGSRHLIFSALFLVYTYPAINPLIYCIFSKNYRKGFQELLSSLTQQKLCCKKCITTSAVEQYVSYSIECETSNPVILLSVRALQVATYNPNLLGRRSKRLP